MAIFREALYKSPVIENVEVSEDEISLDNLFESTTSFTREMTRLTEAIMMADVDVEYNVVNESLTVEEADEIVEESLKDFGKRTVEIIENMKKKVIEWYNKFVAFIQKTFKTGEEFVKAYSAEIDKCNIAGLKLNLKYPDMSAGNAKVKEATSDILDVAIDSNLQRIKEYASTKARTVAGEVSKAYFPESKETLLVTPGIVKQSKEAILSRKEVLAAIAKSKDSLVKACDAAIKTAKSAEAKDPQAIKAMQTALSAAIKVKGIEAQAYKDLVSKSETILRAVLKSGKVATKSAEKADKAAKKDEAKADKDTKKDETPKGEEPKTESTDVENIDDEVTTESTEVEETEDEVTTESCNSILDRFLSNK